MSNHIRICDAPLCKEDTDVALCVWYADEPICTRGPLTDWQKVQKRIQKKYLAGTLKDIDGFYDIAHLRTIGRVTDSTRGINPRLRDENSAVTVVTGGVDSPKGHQNNFAKADLDDDSDHSAYSRTPDR